MRSSLKNIGLGTGAVALVAIGVALLASSSNGVARAPVAVSPPPLPVPVAAVDQRTVPVYLDFVATTEAIRNVTLEAKVTGYLASQPVGDGADVLPGQLLYQIDPRDYQAALDQANAQARRDAAAFDYSRVSQHRTAALSKDGWATQDAFDQTTSALNQSQATLAADAAAVEAAKLNLGYTEMRAPFAGRLGRSLVHEGTLINASGTQLNTFVQLDPIYVTFNPSETDLGRLGEDPGKDNPGRGDDPGPGRKAIRGDFDLPRQHCGPEHRHHCGAGDHRQSGPQPAARRIRARAPARGRPARHAAGAAGGPGFEPAWQVCLRRG